MCDIQGLPGTKMSPTHLICENIIPLGSLPVVSSCDMTEIHATVKKMVEQRKANGKESDSLSQSFSCFAFPLSDETTDFSVLDQRTGQVVQTFNYRNIYYYASVNLKKGHSFVVFTHLPPKPGPSTPPASTKSGYDCFVYHCPSSFEVSRITKCLFQISQRTADAKYPPALSSIPHWKAPVDSPNAPAQYAASLRLHIDIREDDSKSSLGSIAVPKEKPNLFKFRANLEKTLVIGVSRQGDCSDAPHLGVVSCLEIGLAFGRYVSDGDVTTLVTNPAKLSTDDANNLIPGASFVVKTAWSPKEPQFELLNTVTDRDRFVFFTVMCHLALEMLTEPIALSCVCRAKVFRQEENFWLPPDRRPCTEDVNIQLTEVVDENKGWIFMNRLSVLNLSSPFSDVMRTLNSSTTGVTEGAVPQHPTPSNSPINHGCPDSKADNEEMPNGTCNPEDDDEPLMSGNGVVINDVTDDQLVVAWGALMAEWQTRLNAAPPTAASASLPPPPSADDALLCGGAGVEAGPLAKRIRQLVRRGIPDVLRAETWQMLAGHPAADPGLIEVYRILLTKPCRFDTDIQRDLPRTFPAHDFFRDRQGQEILFQITRAYALYDEDVGYCQGISFIAAALLLHLPEKQAFCLLVKIMSNYGTRLLFMQNCEGLFRCLHQFECLLADQLPDVAKAFNDLGIKAHMYASQWFLTLFMTKFPINLVFRILDIFLCDGLLFIFKVMISLLKVSRRDLLGLDFEGTLKFFRVTLPKRFRSREACDQLIFTASTAKVSATKLIRFAKDWERTKMEEADSTSPLRALQREVWELREQCSRLEKENEMLAEKVLTSKAGMQRDIDKLDDMVETLKIELFNSQRELVEKEEECKLLENDTAKVKEMFRQTLERHQLEHQQQQSIIEEYKTITSNLSKRVEKEADSASSGLPQTFIDAVLSCSGDCRRTLDAKAPGWSTNTFNLVADANNADSSVPSGLSPLEDQVAFLARRVKELELELAQSKVHLVDEQCMSQELNHQLVRAAAELEELKASNAASLYNPRHWLAKKWTTVTSRNATAAAAPASSDGAFRFQTD